MVISQAGQLFSQPCFVFVKPVALQIWSASFVGLFGVVAVNVVILSRVSAVSAKIIAFILVFQYKEGISCLFLEADYNIIYIILRFFYV